MVKEKRILSYFLGWLIVGFIICFIGVNKIFATTTTEYENIGYLTDYTLYYVQADYSDLLLNIEEENQYQLEQVIAFILDIDNYTFNAGITYNIEISMPLNTLTNANRYEVKDENNNLCTVTQIDNTVQNYPNFTFNCPNTTRGISLKIYNNNNEYIIDSGLFRWNYTYLRKQIISQDLGVIENQQSQIIDQNNQIIQGQEEIKDTIKDELNTCRDSINIFNTYFIQGAWAFADGHFFASDRYIATNDFINVVPGKTYTLSFKSNKNLNNGSGYIYFNDGTYVSYNMTSVKTFTIPNDVNQIKINLFNNDGVKPSDVTEIQIQEGSIATEYEEPNTKICSNKIDETNDKLDGIQGALTDSSTPDLSGLEDSIGWLPPGPVDSILNLPLTMLNSLTNSLSTSCTPLNLTLPYVNENIQIPCLSAIFEQITGVNGLWTWVGTIASVLILYNYLLNLYAWVDRVLTLRAEFDEAMGADLANWGRL